MCVCVSVCVERVGSTPLKVRIHFYRTKFFCSREDQISEGLLHPGKEKSDKKAVSL